MIEEIWKDIPGYEGYYQISSKGSVKSLERIIIRRDNKPYHQKETIIKTAINHKGYVICHLSKNYKSHFKQVHRLVAETFIPNPNKLPQVNHIDGNKENNCINNLEWVTNYDNIQYSIKTGLRNIKEIVNKMQKARMKAVQQYDMNGKLLKTFKSIKDAQEELHIPNQNIIKVCQGKRKMAHNYIFKYAEG